MTKESPEQLRERFDNDVDRFSDEEKGQEAIADAALVLNMVERGITAMHPDARDLCDLGCGGGNFSVRISRKLPKIGVTLVDLSRVMLDRAVERLQAQNVDVKSVFQGDIREFDFPDESFDVVVASASLHHLRSREEWKTVFQNVFRSLRAKGSFWICDIAKHENPEIETLQRERYADFLADLKDRAFQEEVFRLIELSDTPETIDFQIRTLREAGFEQLDLVHKNMLYFSLVARKLS